MPYKELYEDYRYEKNETGTIGVRAFYESTSGTIESLPIVGTSSFARANGAGTDTNCLCRRLSSVLFAPNGQSKWIEKVVAEYNTNPGGAQVIVPDLLERRFQMGGEVVSCDNGNWKWEQSAVAMTQPLFFSNVMGTFTRKIKKTSDAAKRKFIQEKIIPQAGTINSAEFEDFREGSVLFSGMSGGTQADEAGHKIWVFELEFTYRIIRGLTYNLTDVTKDDWLYLYSKEGGGVNHGGWDKPKNQVNEYLYTKTNLAELFT